MYSICFKHKYIIIYIHIIYIHTHIYIYIPKKKHVPKKHVPSKALVAKAHKVQDPVLGMVNANGTSVEVQNLQEPIGPAGSTDKFAMEHPQSSWQIPSKWLMFNGRFVSLQECRFVLFGTDDKQKGEKLAKGYLWMLLKIQTHIYKEKREVATKICKIQSSSLERTLLRQMILTTTCREGKPHWPSWGGLH